MTTEEVLGKTRLILRKVKDSNLDIAAIDVNGEEMYGIYYVCGCSDCNNKPKYLVIAPRPDTAVKMLCSTTGNIEFLMNLNSILDKMNAERN